MVDTEELTGSVDRLLYQNTENGYTVFVLTTRSTNTVTVQGHLPTITPGEDVTLTGSWVMHPKFGKQFHAKNCVHVQPNTLVGLKKYLGSGLIKGIGPTYAEKLVDAFGSDILEIIEHEPHKLLKVDGVGPKRVEKITHAWQEQKEVAKVMIFLRERDISTVYATKIYKTYGHQAITIITENPYRLAEDIWGIGFKTADQIAQKSGFDRESVKRIRAGVLFYIKQAVGKGHLYCEVDNLKKGTLELLELHSTDDIQRKVTHALHDLYNERKIALVSPPSGHLVTLSQYYYTEKSIATSLQELQNYPDRHALPISDIYKQLQAESGSGMQLNEDQQKGILQSLEHPVSIVTGGPGTGKTTLIKKLLDTLDAQNLRYKLAAPTGRAAKRMMEGTGRHAVTIHRLLEFDFQTMRFTHNQENALDIDFLIVDEASMIDIFLAHALIQALPHNAHLVLIGDTDQLPSVGAGNFLYDLIASSIIPCTQLTRIFRQAQDSLIIVNAHRINNGDFPHSFLPEAKRDFLFIKENEPQNVPLHLENIYTKGLKKYGITPDNAITLVPMHRGSVGTQKLNHDLQKILNRQQQAGLSHTGTTYMLNDRVMQLRNNYDKKVFNGDIGTITEINTHDKTMIVRFNSYAVEYEYHELNELTLSYAISIHKSQGSEYSAVIVPLFTQHFTLLQRNLLYTAITRAKKLCIFIGQPRAIGMAINNNKSTQRITLLREYLTSDLQCR